MLSDTLKSLDLQKMVDGIIGDVPVSEQLSLALEHMADKDHKHEEYVSREEFNALKRDVDKLIDLIGDTPVSEQINEAINKKGVDIIGN